MDRLRIYRDRGLPADMLNDQPPNSALFSHLTSEIHRLTDEQVEALRMATFVGMTEEEVREYESRAEHLSRLVTEFRLLISKRTI